ncbi:PREDICTED: tetraspanin-7-like isoform X2 [Priapulus caudatus]|uniref:Tetraspanin n=1 Tax=Priapulus caudatus TaxID=37621 RepID=A0ABM1E7P2_PRICU|nr:PREDICTED: tetraspanin-7-like isoform X2 [Priapulus caudatus]
MGKRLQTVAALGCMKTLLMIFNFLFFVIGLAILVLGVYSKVQLYVYMELMANYYTHTPYIMIAIGAFIVLLGVGGCFCTIKGNSYLLYAYSVILFIIFIAELSAGISAYIFKGKIYTAFEDGLNIASNNYGQDPAASTDEAMDHMQKTLHCCGIKKYSDWLNTTYGSPGQVPESCCIDQANTTCIRTGFVGTSADITTTIYVKGCHKEVVSFVDENIGIIAGAATGFAFLQILGVLLACCLAKNINKNKYEQVA